MGWQMSNTKLILDPASSMRSFYFDKKDERVLFGDIREDETHLLTNNQTIHIKPDQVMDFRNIPYPDESFQCVVFDPPHMLKLTEKSWMRKKSFYQVRVTGLEMPCYPPSDLLWVQIT
jgi:hypothetical protein